MLVRFTAIFPSPLLSLPCVVSNIMFPLYILYMKVFVIIFTFILLYSTQETEEGYPCKAVAQPLLCSVGTVCHLHHQHCLNWCTCALWSGLCSHALLLPGCVLLDGSRSHPVAQEVGDCVQTGHHKLCQDYHGNMLG